MEAAEEDPVGDEQEGEVPTTDALQIVPGCTAKTVLGGYTTWLFFARPDNPCNGVPGGMNDYHAIMELTRLIKSVPTGGRIDGHFYAITIDVVGQALFDAQSRGVDVRISTDGRVAASTDTVKTEYLDRLSGTVYCTSSTTNSCVSSVANASSHTKLFVFSRAMAPDLVETDNVVWFGSQDPTLSTGTQVYGNAVTIYGDSTLYSNMRGYLDDLRLRKRYADYYDPASGRGALSATAANMAVSPEADTDLINTRLNDVTPTATCQVRVMQQMIGDGRTAVIDRLVAMKKGGCKVSIVASSIDPNALAAFKAVNIPMRKHIVHDKLFIVYGQVASGYQYRVYTGSQNVTVPGNSKNDDILVRLAPETTTHPVYDEFVRHFDDAYNLGQAF
jgi:phosphatidylserine/phosphatidylglycerophosphate/cardiolipin synthase-like enzyme